MFSLKGIRSVRSEVTITSWVSQASDRNPISLRTLKHRLRDLPTVSQSLRGGPGPFCASEPSATHHGKSSVTPTSFLLPSAFVIPNSTGRNSYMILRKTAKERQ